MSTRRATPSAIQAAADENMLVAFGLLVPHSISPAAGTATFGGAVAVVTGARVPFFNPVIVVDPSVKPNDVRAAVTWARTRGVEPCIQVRADLDPAVAPVAADLGLAPDPWSMPGLVRDPIPDPIPPGPAELELVVVREDEDLRAWYAAAGEGMRELIPPSFAFDPAVRMVVGSIAGQPVCNSIVVGSSRALGIYSVGTSKDVRRRGYGRAITWAAIEAGRDAWGTKSVVLQSSEMGDPVYRAMGFVEVCRYVIYAPPSG
jgi:GNAT superfamily N-acetyltransferase